jgi:methylglyoxal synthase
MLSIALHADNEKKNLLDNFCIAYKNILSRYHLLATESTANHVKAATGLEVSSLLSGRLGGDRQLESAIANDEVDLLISFEGVDLNRIQDKADQSSLIRLCDLYNIPVATNLSTAECLILSLQRGDLDWRSEIRHG